MTSVAVSVSRLMRNDAREPGMLGTAVRHHLLDVRRERVQFVDQQVEDVVGCIEDTRIDGSSRLAEGRKYATFPSVALGYRAVDETPVGPVSSLKFRGSYGITGNTSVNPYQTQGGLTRTSYSWGNAGAFGYQYCRRWNQLLNSFCFGFWQRCNSRSGGELHISESGEWRLVHWDRR